MTAVTLRTIAPEERDAVLDLLAGWLDDRAFFARYFAFDPTFRDDLCFVAAAGGRLVSTLQVFRKDVRVAGAVLAVGGVGNVYTPPDWRGTGLAGALLGQAPAAMATRGSAPMRGAPRCTTSRSSSSTAATPARSPTAPDRRVGQLNFCAGRAKVRR